MARQIIYQEFIRRVLAGAALVLLAVTANAEDLQTIDQEAQQLRAAVLDLGREVAMLEEEILYPADTQLAVFVAMDLGEFFELDSVELQLDGKTVSNYLYTEREVDALYRGAVHKLYVGDITTGEHELVAFFTGKGPHQRDYRRGAKLTFEKADASKYVELMIADNESALRPDFVVREWD